MAAQADAETIAAFRELLDRVVIIDAPNNAVEVQVIGRLAAILGNDAEIFGGAMVAEERFKRDPHLTIVHRRAA